MARKNKKKRKSSRVSSKTKNSIVKERTVQGSSSGRSKKQKRRKVLPKSEAVISGSVQGTKGDPLDFQISAKVKIPKGRTITANVLTEAIRYRIKTGRSPRGIQLRIIRWRNPARINTNPDWRYPDDPETIANSEKMGLHGSPQQAAWVSLSAAVGAVQVSNFTFRNR